MGIDPGFAHLGMAVIERLDPKEAPRLVWMKVLETAKAPKKVMRDLRVAADDQRRLKYYWDQLVAEMKAHQVVAIGVESYAPWPGQMGGSAWKVGFAYQLAMCAGWAHGVLPMVFRPDDLKRRLLGRNAGTKGAVEAALKALVSGFADALQELPKTKREHVADAVGHAVLAMEEAARMRAMYGGTF